MTTTKPRLALPLGLAKPRVLITPRLDCPVTSPRLKFGAQHIRRACSRPQTTYLSSTFKISLCAVETFYACRTRCSKRDRQSSYCLNSYSVTLNWPKLHRAKALFCSISHTRIVSNRTDHLPNFS